MKCPLCGHRMFYITPLHSQTKSLLRCTICGTEKEEQFTDAEVERRADQCPNHDCPKCGYRMTDRQCLTCTNATDEPIRIEKCYYCDGAFAGEKAILRSVNYLEATA